MNQSERDILQQCILALRLTVRSSHQRCSLKKAYNFIKTRLWHRCFPVNFCEISKNTFFMEHLWWLLLNCNLNQPLKFSLPFTATEKEQNIVYIRMIKNFKKKQNKGFEVQTYQKQQKLHDVVRRNLGRPEAALQRCFQKKVFQ